MAADCAALEAGVRLFRCDALMRIWSHEIHPRVIPEGFCFLSFCYEPPLRAPARVGMELHGTTTKHGEAEQRRRNRIKDRRVLWRVLWRHTRGPFASRGPSLFELPRVLLSTILRALTLQAGETARGCCAARRHEDACRRAVGGRRQLHQAPPAAKC